MTPQEEKELAELDELDALDAEEAEPTWLRISKAKQDLARMQQARKDVEETTLGERIGAGALGAANTMGMGFADEARGLATAIPRLMPGGESPIDAYVRGRDAQRGEAKAAESRNLRSTLGGEVLGNAPTVLGGFAAKVPQGIATAAQQGVGALVKQGAKIGAAGGAVGGFGMGEGLTGSLEQALKGGAIGGLFGGAGGGLGGLASAEARAASRSQKPAPAPAAPSAGPGMARRGAASVVDMAAKAAEKAPVAVGAAIGGGVGGPGGAAVGGALGSEFGGGAGKAAGGYLAQLAQRLRGEGPPAPIAGLPEWQPAVGSSTATAKPAGTPLPPAVEVPPIPAATPAQGASITAEELRGMGGMNLMGELNRRLESVGVTPPRVEPTPIPVLSKTTPARGRPIEAPPAPVSRLPTEQASNVRRALALGNPPEAIAQHMKIPIEDVRALAAPPPKPTAPPVERPPTGTTTQIGEEDIVAAMSPEAFDISEAAMSRFGKASEARDIFEAIVERLGEKRPAWAAETKKDLRSNVADPSDVMSKVNAVLSRGDDPRLVEQALARRRGEEVRDVARLARGGGTDAIDDMVASAIAGGAETMEGIQRATGLRLGEIQKSLDRHSAGPFKREPKRAKVEDRSTYQDPSEIAGPKAHSPVYTEIFGEPFHISESSAAAAAAKLPFGPEDAAGRAIFNLKGQGFQPQQIAKKLGLPIETVWGILKQRGGRTRAP